MTECLYSKLTHNWKTPHFPTFNIPNSPGGSIPLKQPFDAGFPLHWSHGLEMTSLATVSQWWKRLGLAHGVCVCAWFISCSAGFHRRHNSGLCFKHFGCANVTWLHFTISVCGCLRDFPSSDHSFYFRREPGQKHGRTLTKWRVNCCYFSQRRRGKTWNLVFDASKCQSVFSHFRAKPLSNERSNRNHI